MKIQQTSLFICGAVLVPLLTGCGSGTVDPETLKKLPSPRQEMTDFKAEPNAMTSPLREGELELMAQAQDLLRAGDYEAIENRLKQLRTSRAANAMGQSKLLIFYSGLGYVRIDSPRSEVRIQEQLLANWRNKHPESLAAQLAQAYLYSSWMYMADDEPDNNSQATDEKLAEAQAIIDATRAKGQQELDWHLVACKVGYLSLGSSDKRAAVVDAALARFPDVTEFHLQHVSLLGGPWQQYADRAAQSRKGSEGDKLYAQLWWYACAIARTVPCPDLKNFDWPRAKRGFEVLLKGDDPTSVAGAYAVAAWIARDRATLRHVFVKYKARTGAWRSFRNYLEARKWVFTDRA